MQGKVLTADIIEDHPRSDTHLTVRKGDVPFVLPPGKHEGRYQLAGGGGERRHLKGTERGENHAAAWVVTAKSAVSI